MDELLGKCLVKTCHSQILYSRGLCRACYYYAHRIVAYRITTWKDLVNAGLVLRRRGNKRFKPLAVDRLRYFSEGLGVGYSELALYMREGRRKVYHDTQTRKSIDKRLKMAKERELRAGEPYPYGEQKIDGESDT